MKTLVAGEESQAITIALRERGHEAYSCDLQECSGGYPQWHIKGDLRELLTERFDLVVFHPECTYLANSGVHHLTKNPSRWLKLRQAIDFFNLRHKFNADYVGTENPIPHKYAVTGIAPDNSIFADGIGKYDQIIQPWQFGHQKMKATCFWLKGLPPLIPTDVVGPPPKDRIERIEWQDIWMESPGPDRKKNRSKTYPGIAKAIAEQWGDFVAGKMKR